ncbi:hypothetical protein SARC_08623 [Sphaeroforma arctica JP610]|uniref:Uncharacterized protein n=1 Tax=Sphaeroforma arctica JP610 TaxID=667725 RepID=A0A0L0FQJ2_9EUKA|nr:hypothetical protein SARC_08623 [Sphaeroforma arctica JP610]KNC78969.1 hypothetical protein SARC_08623 [Sphaeroforma arctica JP610]|eukprot:XP_014152871.1 hypothetical protein SARC_08623 [Sphaeroforma arctica JP610]
MYSSAASGTRTTDAATTARGKQRQHYDLEREQRRSRAPSGHTEGSVGEYRENRDTDRDMVGYRERERDRESDRERDRDRDRDRDSDSYSSRDRERERDRDRDRDAVSPSQSGAGARRMDWDGKEKRGMELRSVSGGYVRESRERDRSERERDRDRDRDPRERDLRDRERDRETRDRDRGERRRDGGGGGGVNGPPQTHWQHDSRLRSSVSGRDDRDRDRDSAKSREGNRGGLEGGLERGLSGSGSGRARRMDSAQILGRNTSPVRGSEDDQYHSNTLTSTGSITSNDNMADANPSTNPGTGRDFGEKASQSIPNGILSETKSQIPATYAAKSGLDSASSGARNSNSFVSTHNEDTGHNLIHSQSLSGSSSYLSSVNSGLQTSKENASTGNLARKDVSTAGGTAGGALRGGVDTALGSTSPSANVTPTSRQRDHRGATSNVVGDGGDRERDRVNDRDRQERDRERDRQDRDRERERTKRDRAGGGNSSRYSLDRIGGASREVGAGNRMTAGGGPDLAPMPPRARPRAGGGMNRLFQGALKDVRRARDTEVKKKKEEEVKEAKEVGKIVDSQTHAEGLSSSGPSASDVRSGTRNNTDDDRERDRERSGTESGAAAGAMVRTASRDSEASSMMVNDSLNTHSPRVRSSSITSLVGARASTPSGKDATAAVRDRDRERRKEQHTTPHTQANLAVRKPTTTTPQAHTSGTSTAVVRKGYESDQAQPGGLALAASLSTSGSTSNLSKLHSPDASSSARSSSVTSLRTASGSVAPANVAGAGASGARMGRQDSSSSLSSSVHCNSISNKDDREQERERDRDRDTPLQAGSVSKPNGESVGSDREREREGRERASRASSTVSHAAGVTREQQQQQALAASKMLKSGGGASNWRRLSEDEDSYREHTERLERTERDHDRAGERLSERERERKHNEDIRERDREMRDRERERDRESRDGHSGRDRDRDRDRDPISHSTAIREWDRDRIRDNERDRERERERDIRKRQGSNAQQQLQHGSMKSPPIGANTNQPGGRDRDNRDTRERGDRDRDRDRDTHGRGNRDRDGNRRAGDRGNNDRIKQWSNRDAREFEMMQRAQQSQSSQWQQQQHVQQALKPHEMYQQYAQWPQQHAQTQAQQNYMNMMNYMYHSQVQQHMGGPDQWAQLANMASIDPVLASLIANGAGADVAAGSHDAQMREQVMAMMAAQQQHHALNGGLGMQGANYGTNNGMGGSQPTMVSGTGDTMMFYPTLRPSVAGRDFNLCVELSDSEDEDESDGDVSDYAQSHLHAQQAHAHDSGDASFDSGLAMNPDMSAQETLDATLTLVAPKQHSLRQEPHISAFGACDTSRCDHTELEVDLSFISDNLRQIYTITQNILETHAEATLQHLRQGSSGKSATPAAAVAGITSDDEDIFQYLSDDDDRDTIYYPNPADLVTASGDAEAANAVGDDGDGDGDGNGALSATEDGVAVPDMDTATKSETTGAGDAVGGDSVSVCGGPTTSTAERGAGDQSGLAGDGRTHAASVDTSAKQAVGSTGDSTDPERAGAGAHASGAELERSRSPELSHLYAVADGVGVGVAAGEPETADNTPVLKRTQRAYVSLLSEDSLSTDVDSDGTILATEIESDNEVDSTVEVQGRLAEVDYMLDDVLGINDAVYTTATHTEGPASRAKLAGQAAGAAHGTDAQETRITQIGTAVPVQGGVMADAAATLSHANVGVRAAAGAGAGSSMLTSADVEDHVAGDSGPPDH